MKKIFFSLFFVLAMFVSGNAFSQDDHDPWVLVGENDKYKVYLNKDSTKNIGDSKTDFDIWLKWECIGECNDGYKNISYSIQNWNIFCGKKEYNVPKTIDYYTDGETNTYTNETPSAIMENSPNEKVYNYFCNKDKDVDTGK